MAWLIDTGVLLRAFEATSSDHAPIRRAFWTLLQRNDRLFVAQQNLAEFWNVSTRPVDKNGYGLSAGRAAKRVAIIEKFCEIVTEDKPSFLIRKSLLTKYGLIGVSVHDARLVSVMVANGIEAILTLNLQDFRRYSGITVVAPNEVGS